VVFPATASYRACGLGSLPGWAGRGSLCGWAHGNGTADELTYLAEPGDHGVLSEADYERGKKKVLSRPAA